MSVSSRPPEDLSTRNANWGTLVILLVVVIIAVVIATVAYKNKDVPQPAMSITGSGAAPMTAPSVETPTPAGLPSASVVPPAGRADVPGMAPTTPAVPGAMPSGPSNGAASSQAPGSGAAGAVPPASPAGAGG